MKESSPVSILVVEDSKEWRDQIRRLLQTRPEWKIVAEACDGMDAVQKAAQLHPQIVLLDVGLPTLNGIETARIIRQRCTKSKIIFLTENTDSDVRDEAISAWAFRYILKSNSAHEILNAIAAALCDLNAIRSPSTR